MQLELECVSQLLTWVKKVSRLLNDSLSSKEKKLFLSVVMETCQWCVWITVKTTVNKVRSKKICTSKPDLAGSKSPTDALDKEKNNPKRNTQ